MYLFREVSVGEVSVGDMSGRGSVHWGNIHRGCVWSGKCPSGKCPSGKRLSGMCPSGSCLSGKCPDTVTNREIRLGPLTNVTYFLTNFTPVMYGFANVMCKHIVSRFCMACK